MMRIVVVFTVCMVLPSRGKIFTRCELAKELLKQEFPPQQIRDWVCLVESESSRRTDVVGGPDEDGSYDYGLFQINDRYWCTTGERPGNGCNVRCRDLLTDNITMAVKCTRKIYSQQGFTAWVGWVSECEDKLLPDLGECGNIY